MVRAGEAPAASVAALTLLTVTAFVATNTVFSPQFHLWLIPLAALALEGRRRGLSRQAVRGAWVIVLATLIVPTFYPSREYAMGLGLWRTAVVVLRNLMLLYATVCLWRAAVNGQNSGTGTAPASPIFRSSLARRCCVASRREDVACTDSDCSAKLRAAGRSRRRCS